MARENKRKGVIITLVMLSLGIGLIGGYVLAHRSMPEKEKGSTATAPERAVQPMPDMKDMPGMATPAAPPGAVVLPAVQQQLIGVRTVSVGYAPLDEEIRAVGTINHDERKLTQVNLRVAGWIQKVFVDAVGKPVRKGEFSIWEREQVWTD